jgi:hypothetical protein
MLLTSGYDLRVLVSFKSSFDCLLTVHSEPISAWPHDKHNLTRFLWTNCNDSQPQHTRASWLARSSLCLIELRIKNILPVVWVVNWASGENVVWGCNSNQGGQGLAKCQFPCDFIESHSISGQFFCIALDYLHFVTANPHQIAYKSTMGNVGGIQYAVSISILFCL